MTDSPTVRAVRRLVSDRLSEIAAAVRSGGEIPADEVATLQRLSGLAGGDQGRGARQVGPVWPVAMLLGATLLIVSVLLFARVGATEIELELEVTELTFSLARPDILFRNLLLERVSVSGLNEIELPFELAGPGERRISDPDLAIGVEVASAGDVTGSITIAALAPSPPADVRLRLVQAGDYRLSVRGPEFGIGVDLFGPLVISIPGAGRRGVEFPVPVPIMLRAEADRIVDLDMRVLDLGRQDMALQVPVREVGFQRVDELGGGDAPLVRALSTILSGTIYFESLNGSTHAVRPGERLRLDGADGEIRRLRLEKDHLTILWGGSVSGLETGSVRRPRNLMPTWLEWLRSRHGLSLLWGSTLYIFGLILGVMRWLKRPL